MARERDTVLTVSLKRFGVGVQKYIQNCISEPLIVKLVIEDARDSFGRADGTVFISIDIEPPEGWGGDNTIEIHGTVGFEKSKRRGRKEDEAYLDGVTVGEWGEGSEAIGLIGCSVGEFLTHLFTLFAIKAGNESVLLDNAAGPRGEYIYNQVGFIESRGDRAMYGENNEMMVSLTGKTKNKDAGQLWAQRYNKFRKKLECKLKGNETCRTFWKCVPPALSSPGPVHYISKGAQNRETVQNRETAQNRETVQNRETA